MAGAFEENRKRESASCLTLKQRRSDYVSAAIITRFSFDVRNTFDDAASVRLSLKAIEALREETARLDPRAEIYLYGSRTDDTARGGDIDLLVVSDTLGFRDVLLLRRAILDRIGWQQLDLAVRRRDQLDEPLAAMARTTGVRL